MLCSHYNHSEHDPDSYFQLIGYPEWGESNPVVDQQKDFQKHKRITECLDRRNSSVGFEVDKD